MQSERRRSIRLSTSIPVGLKFPTGPKKEGWGRILDISPEGLRIESRFPLKVAGVVYVTFSLRVGVVLENLRARIVRAHYQDGYYEAGISFDDLVDVETLRDVIAAVANEGGIAVS